MKKIFLKTFILSLILFYGCAKGIDNSTVKPVNTKNKKEITKKDDTNKTETKEKKKEDKKPQGKEKNPKELFESMEELKALSEESGKFYEAKDLENAKKNLARIGQLVEEDVLVTIEEGRVLNALAVAAKEAEDLENAKKILGYATKVFEISQGNLVSNFSVNLISLAEILETEEKPDEAEIYLKNALHMLNNGLGESHPLTLSQKITLGDFYLRSKKPDEAEKTFSDLLEYLKKNAKQEDQNILVVMKKLRDVYAEKNEEEKLENIKLEIEEYEKKLLESKESE